MTSLLGYPLDAAVRLVQAQGRRAEIIEVRSKKGIPDGEYRIVRERTRADGTVCLAYARFLTELNTGEDVDAGRSCASHLAVEKNHEKADE